MTHWNAACNMGSRLDRIYMDVKASEDNPIPGYQVFAYGDLAMRVVRLGGSNTPDYKQDRPFLPDRAYSVKEVAEKVKKVWQSYEGKIEYCQGAQALSLLTEIKDKAIREGSKELKKFVTKVKPK